MNKFKNKILPWIPAIAWMILIFSLSAQPAADSNGLSRGLTKIIIGIIGRILPLDVQTSSVNSFISQLNYFVRKFAHFSAYMILAVLVSAAFVKNGFKAHKVLIFAFAVCVLYAASDEIHQLFVPGRGSQLKDVIIDSAGSLVGIAISRIIFKLRT